MTAPRGLVAIVAAMTVSLLVAWGCSGGESHGPSADAGCVAPSLPTAGAGRIRLANLSTRPGNADFCVRSSGTAWSSSVFAGGGPSCQSGLSYQQVTVPFAAPAGSIDVKTIAAGAACSSTATSEVDGVEVNGTGAPVVTLVRFGGGSTPERLVALPEETGPISAYGTAERLRVVNALSSGGPIEVGNAGASSLPATLSPPVTSAVAPGQATSGSAVFWVFDASGYANIPGGAAIGAALQGQTSALFVATAATAPDQQTLFAMGDSAATAATDRIRGLLCEDRALPSSASPLLARCALTALPSLAVDTVNASLYGTDAPFEDARRPYILQAIAARQTDLMCLVETSRDSDKAAIAHAAQARFPYAYYVQTTLATQPTDPARLDGGVPPAPTAPPCAGVDPNAVSTAMQCVAQQCTNTGDETGYISTSSCLSSACGAKLLPLYHMGAAQDRCFDCIVYDVQSQLPISQVQQACTQNVAQPFDFDGATSSMILSHYPLSHQQAFILPGTGFRHAVLYAQVALEGNQTLDFYCAQLISPFIDGTLSYTGNYGQDALLPDGGIENGWEDEQDLQATRTIAFVKKTSGASGLPAIIAGDWHTSVPAQQPDGGLAVGALSPEIFAALDAAFSLDEPAGYAEACNYCPSPQNPYNGGIGPMDVSHTFLEGFPAASVTDDEYWATSSSVVPITGIPYEPAPTGGVGPAWEFYPRVVHVVRPPTP